MTESCDKYLPLTIFICIFLLITGCNTLNNLLDEEYPGESGPGINVGSLEIGITNLAPKSLDSGSLGYTSCTVSPLKVEVSHDKSSWITLLEFSDRTIDLANSSDALDRLSIIGKKENLVAESFANARLYIKSIKRDSIPQINYTANPDTPLNKKDYIVLDSSISFRVEAQKNTLLIFDIDSSQAMNNLDMSGITNEIISMFTDLNLIPYLDPLSDRDGVWCNGSIYGYYKENILKNNLNAQIGTISFFDNDRKNQGIYTFSSGRYAGMSGNLKIEDNPFAKYGRILFFLSSNYSEGIWISDREKSEGNFFLNTLWPYSSNGILTDSLGGQYGDFTLYNKKSLFKVAGKWKITITEETGSVYFY
jgi:hypothetical protein